MKMNKKIGISIIGLIFAFILFSIIWNLKINSKENNNSNNTTLENKFDASIEGIEDECTEEWILYNQELQTAFQEVNTKIENENIHYLIKSKDGYICIYYLDEKGDEILYRKTSISIEYLSQKDLDNLRVGIEVVGNEELNKILEDFE